MRTVLIFLSLLTLNLNLAVAEPNQQNIELLAASCAACHGTRGHSQAGIPSLAGLSPAYFIKQMKDFANSDRPSSVMFTYAKAYSEREIKLLASYFSAQK